MTRNQRSAKRVRMIWSVLPFAGGITTSSAAGAPVVSESDTTAAPKAPKHPLLSSVAAR